MKRTAPCWIVSTSLLFLAACPDDGAPPPAQPATPTSTPATQPATTQPAATQPAAAAKPPETPMPEPQSEPPAAAANTATPRVVLSTTLGDITLELDAAKAPISVENFLTYVADGFYEGTIFHRVMSTFMIQGGGFTPELDKKPGLRGGIKNEWQNGLKNVKGTISMARLPGQPDSATAQFFINVVDNTKSLDQPQADGAAYAVFGKVVAGMDVVEAIRMTPVQTHPKYDRGGSRVVPIEPVIINAAKKVP